MTYPLHFFSEVEADVFSAYVWYGAKSPGLGEEFLRIFYACVKEIPENPLLYPKVCREFRRRLLRRFPYAIYFMIKDNQIIMSGLFHCARDPHTIRTTLQDREEEEKP